MKTCSKCRELKPLTDFHRNARSADGHAVWCKPCVADRRRDRYANEPGYKERESAKALARDHADPRKAKDRRLRKKFNLTIEQYDEMLAAQDGRCYICRKKPRGDKMLAVDHDHTTGLVRGLCDDHCNYALLGAFHENVDLFRRAVEYLTDPPALRLGIEVYVPNAPPRVSVCSPPSCASSGSHSLSSLSRSSPLIAGATDALQHVDRRDARGRRLVLARMGLPDRTVRRPHLHHTPASPRRRPTGGSMIDQRCENALEAVLDERQRQENHWPGQTCADALPHTAKLAILLEEVGEVAHELTEALNAGDIEAPDTDKLRTELVQVAAVAVAWIESLTKVEA